MWSNGRVPDYRSGGPGSSPGRSTICLLPFALCFAPACMLVPKRYRLPTFVGDSRIGRELNLDSNHYLRPPCAHGHLPWCSCLHTSYCSRGPLTLGRKVPEAKVPQEPGRDSSANGYSEDNQPSQSSNPMFCPGNSTTYVNIVIECEEYAHGCKTCGSCNDTIGTRKNKCNDRENG